MDVLDLVLIVALALFGWAGYRRGFLVGVLGFAGFVGGGAVGMLVVPAVLGGRAVSVTYAGLALASVLVCAAIGQVLAAWLGSALRSRLPWQPVRQVDAIAGAALSVGAMLLVVWFLALAVVQGPFPELTRQVHDSRVLATVDDVMPDSARQLFANFRGVLDGSVFPQVFGSLSPGRVAPVDAPDSALLRDPDVKRARKSIVEIDGLAASCNEKITGTGFVIAPNRVVTNAHVVAGVSAPRVLENGTGFGHAATVVHFDPKTDLAVLSVPGLGLPTLPLHTAPLDRGDDGVVAGYPGGGPYTASAAKVRERQEARGRDIYGSGSVIRDVYSLRTSVRPGNSGGPLLLSDGSVAGVVFAAAIGDKSTGYALTISEIEPDLKAGVRATAEVGTGRCT